MEKKRKLKLKEKLRERRQYFFAIKQMVAREVKRKYARSYLGIAWSVLNPLLRDYPKVCVNLQTDVR